MMISKLLFAEIIVENPCPVQKALMENRNLIMMQGRVSTDSTKINRPEHNIRMY